MFLDPYVNQSKFPPTQKKTVTLTVPLPPPKKMMRDDVSIKRWIRALKMLPSEICDAFSCKNVDNNSLVSHLSAIEIFIIEFKRAFYNKEKTNRV